VTPRVVAVVQARMSSQRLPGKVLAPLPSAAGPELTVLDWATRRTGRAEAVDAVVVATSTDPSDDELARHCAATGVDCFRGNLHDVLDRCYLAARAHDARTVVRVTGDCPLVDPGVVDLIVAEHLARGGDFTANRLPPPAPRTYPIGLDVEVVSLAALERAWHEARQQHEREHVLPYLYEEPGRFDVVVLDAPVDAGRVRWTVDTPADLQAVRELVRVAGATVDTSWLELLDVWSAHPELADLNSAIVQRRAEHVDPRAGND
jgi:spore coat polysaccharide biosynthesis protein SpsF